MDDTKTRRIAEGALKPGERILWVGASRTMSYSLRYAPGTLLGMVITGIAYSHNASRLNGPGFLGFLPGLFVLSFAIGVALGIWSMVVESSVSWAVTNQGVLRIRRTGARRIEASHVTSVKAKPPREDGSGDITLEVSYPKGGEDAEPSFQMRSLENARGARTAIERMLKDREGV